MEYLRMLRIVRGRTVWWPGVADEGSFQKMKIVLLILLKCKWSIVVVSSASWVPVFSPAVYMVVIVIIFMSIWIRINYIWDDSCHKLCSCCSRSCLHNLLHNRRHSSLLINPQLVILRFTISKQKSLVPFIREVGLGLFRLRLVAVVVAQEFVTFFKHSIILCFKSIQVILRLFLIELIKLIGFIHLILVYLF